MPKAKVMREVKEVRLAPVSMGVVQLEAQVVAVMELEAKGVGAGVEEAMAVEVRHLSPPLSSVPPRWQGVMRPHGCRKSHHQCRPIDTAGTAVVTAVVGTAHSMEETLAVRHLSTQLSSVQSSVCGPIDTAGSAVVSAVACVAQLVAVVVRHLCAQ